MGVFFPERGKLQCRANNRNASGCRRWVGSRLAATAAAGAVAAAVRR